MLKETYQSAIRFAKVGMGVRQSNNSADEEKRLRAKQALALQFSDARGVLMKLGQLLASSSSDQSFEPLLKGIPAIPLEAISPVIEAALGSPLGDVFAKIEASNHAASLGQVHKAYLLNGQAVAIKVQYPDIADRVNAEIALLGLMPGIGPVKKWGFDLKAYKSSFKQNIDRELDYRIEATSQQAFQQQVCVEGLEVPEVYSAYSSKNLLVQSWHDGEFIDSITNWPATDRRRAGEIILATLFKSLFEVGIVHGDPHLGNSYFRHDNDGQVKVVLMDYGCTIALNKNQRLALLKLILATSENNLANPLRYFVALGFDAKKLGKIGDALPMLCRLLFKPFSQNEVFSTQTWEIEKPVKHLLNERRWWFRSAGPAQLLLILRAFQGITQQLNTLQTTVSWTNILQQHISPEIIQQARDFTLPPLVEEDSISTHSITGLANTLKVRVMKNGRQTVNVTLPVEMFLEIESLIPEDVLALLATDKTVDITAIKQSVLDSGLVPQDVFTINNGEKEYAVWLE